MVAPVTDRGVATVTRNFTDEYGHVHARYYEYRHRYYQRKPFTLVLPYDGIRQYLQSYYLSDSNASLPLDADDPAPFNSDINWSRVLNRSYEKVRGQIYDKVGFGVDFAEYRQSVDMIASTATTLFKAYRSIKHLRFGDAAAALRMKFIPKGVSPFKSAANNWLEFHFGWEPLVKDIHDACDVINDPVKSFTYVRSRASEPYSLKQSGTLGAVDYTTDCQGKLSSQQGCRVKFSRPGTLHTLDQWGISNPATIVWELIPFSFVVDWFVNVGSFIDSQTDFAGMTVESSFRTQWLDITVNKRYQTHATVPPTPQWSSSATVRYTNMSRASSLSGIALTVNKLKLPSITRGATAISLLLQAMKSR